MRIYYSYISIIFHLFMSLLLGYLFTKLNNFDPIALKSFSIVLLNLSIYFGLRTCKVIWMLVNKKTTSESVTGFETLIINIVPIGLLTFLIFIYHKNTFLKSDSVVDIMSFIFLLYAVSFITSIIVIIYRNLFVELIYDKLYYLTEPQSILQDLENMKHDIEFLLHLDKNYQYNSKIKARLKTKINFYTRTIENLKFHINKMSCYKFSIFDIFKNTDYQNYFYSFIETSKYSKIDYLQRRLVKDVVYFIFDAEYGSKTKNVKTLSEFYNSLPFEIKDWKKYLKEYIEYSVLYNDLFDEIPEEEMEKKVSKLKEIYLKALLQDEYIFENHLLLMNTVMDNVECHYINKYKLKYDY